MKWLLSLLLFTSICWAQEDPFHYTGELVQARFSLVNDLSRPAETIDPVLAQIDMLSCRDEENRSLLGSGFTIEKRLDDQHIQVWVSTCPEVMAQIKSHPAFTLIEDFSAKDDNANAE